MPSYSAQENRRDANGVKTCAIYLRISQDRTGEQLGVERQEKECRTLAERIGLEVTHVYRDNDISATSGKHRPGFEEMLVDHPEIIIAWHQDRLLRLTSDLEKVIKLEVPIYMVTAGTLDLSTPAGRAVARTVAAWSQYEGEQKALRQKAANVQRAHDGQWQFSNRPYGYERVNRKVKIVEEEAAVIREAFTRYIAGESYYSIVADFNERGILTMAGKKWSITQLRERLHNPAYAGIRTYKGETVATGKWEPLITLEEWENFKLATQQRKSRHDWSNKAKYLLSGLAICGICGERLMARPEYRRRQSDGTKPVVMTYQCISRWCVSRKLEPVDELVRKLILGRMTHPDILQALTPSVDVTPWVKESQELRNRRDGLAALLAEGSLPVSAVREQSRSLQKQIDKLQQRINDVGGGDEVAILAQADNREAHWDNLLTPSQRRNIVSKLMTVTINKQAGTRVFNADDIHIEWNV